jgi:exopolysaccharide biosynthesis polyprenyl glycosylphosphotransferase
LQVADMFGIAAAYVIMLAAFGSGGSFKGGIGKAGAVLILLATLPLWTVFARMYGLYDADRDRATHTTVDELFGVFNLVTVGVWIAYASFTLTGLTHTDLRHAVTFWALAIVLVALYRGLARAVYGRVAFERQRTIIVGSGRSARLAATKILNHPEYGLDLVGIVAVPQEAGSPEFDHVSVLGDSSRLESIVHAHHVDRVLVATGPETQSAIVRELHRCRVNIDIVLRQLTDSVGPRAFIHTLEGLPLIGVPTPRASSPALFVKRLADVILAAGTLVITAPLFLVIAILIKRDSPGSVFFRQVRLGMNMQPFVMLKFRTMLVETTPEEHREFVRATTAEVEPTPHVLHKLERSDMVTPVGRWLRKTSLDELPQLINVLKGEMSLVGPRPCLEYELDGFEPYHYDRFLVPAGMTGLWQVTARGKASYGEALEMDVAYARGWSLGLDLRLLLRTPFEILRAGSTR